jgi:hypothetical protein
MLNQKKVKIKVEDVPAADVAEVPADAPADLLMKLIYKKN